ncbi:FecR family protein [Reichenbachiella ulvae]|uniref:FecR domain-containing protein n=1 Tax=Reichenbachiella ulvae TaxID=2980104 RepID=A0ABT3CV07_9BACT|nr:FecR family protein [Reichenbachiella ulvae]MCV9387406.1 FecR domain-containing protein [Reichenbachiella ulvae]
MEHLITKYFKGELSLEEQHTLTKWIQRDEKNAETFRVLKNYWHFHQSDLKKEEQEVRSMLHARINAEKTSSKSLQKSSKTRKAFYWVAASIALLLSSYIGLRLLDSNQAVQSQPVAKLIEKVSLPGQKIITTLPDGTKVKLNAGSRLIVPEVFDTDRRLVTLIGEAFFEVERDENRPFIIQTDSLQVQVLGTSFNVNAYRGEQALVAVKTGRVAVSNSSDRVELVPNQMASMINARLLKESISKEQLPFAWTEQKLVFNDEAIAQVFQKVSRWYGIQIELNGELNTDKKYTANYDNPTMLEMMDVLSFVYDFKYEFYENEKKLIIN